MASESYHPSDIQQKRFEKELKLISSLIGVKANPRSTPFGIIVRVTYLQNVLNDKEINFDLYLEGKYPFQPPKLLCETVFTFPSASDGRDILTEMLKQKWTPSITSADIIGMIPHFFSSVFLQAQPDLQNKEFGKFHLGSPYYLETWENKDSMNSYYCIENDLKQPQITKDRMIVVTHTVILILELNTQYPGIGFLISWATLQSLNTIKRSKQEPDRITFEWKKIEENPPFTQQFKVHGADEMIDLISRNMRKIGAIVKKGGEKKGFLEDEVNGKELKKMKINEVIRAIEVYEDNFESSMNVEMVNSLMQLYQQAIEYFAAANNPQYDIFLQRMHMLLANDAVLALLQGKTVESQPVKQEYIENKGDFNPFEEKKEEIKLEEDFIQAEVKKKEILSSKDLVLEESKDEIVRKPVESIPEVLVQPENPILPQTEEKKADSISEIHELSKENQPKSEDIIESLSIPPASLLESILSTDSIESPKPSDHPLSDFDPKPDPLDPTSSKLL